MRTCYAEGHLTPARFDRTTALVVGAFEIGNRVELDLVPEADIVGSVVAGAWVTMEGHPRDSPISPAVASGLLVSPS